MSQFYKGSPRDYILDNYGLCALGSACQCGKPGIQWLGTSCPNWQPVSGDLLARLLAMFESGDPCSTSDT